MKISKFTHSCLLVEDFNLTALIDPGNYSTPNLSLTKLDYLLITHEHADHLYLPLVKGILAKFPSVKVISNSSVSEILWREGIKVETSGDENIGVEEVPHEKIFSGPSPRNYLFRIFGKLTHPGDSFHFSLSTPYLALPIQAPWGSTTQAVELAIKLKPKVVVPIHDWHWNNEARNGMYTRLTDYFLDFGIKFLGLEEGVVKL